MNKEQAGQLMIGSWVLAQGECRSVVALTTKKAWFKRGGAGQRDVFRFDQLQGIPLSEYLLKECVSYRQQKTDEGTETLHSIHCYSDTVIAIRSGDSTTYKRFQFLHEVQAYLAAAYRVQIELDVAKLENEMYQQKQCV